MNEYNKNNNIVSKERNHEFDLFDPFGDLFKFPSFHRDNISSLMKTDIKELENSYVIETDLPGFDKKDIDIDFNNGYLTISASRKHSVTEEGKKDKYLRKERYYGSVSRSFYVGDINEDQICAKLDNGTLVVEIPKEPKKEEKKRIEIK